MSETTPRPEPRPHRWWQAAVPGSDGRTERLLLVASPRHPDGARVVLSAAEVAELEDRVVCAVVLSHGTVSHLHVSSAFAPKAPRVWFVELVPDGAPGAHDLLAFGGDDHAAGTLVAEDHLASAAVTSAGQLGAVRWWPESGEIDQVYVQPDRRRQHLGSLLVAAAACLNVTRDLPRLWGDGERTELGEALRNARSWRDRAAPLTHLAPPMTPETSATP